MWNQVDYFCLLLKERETLHPIFLMLSGKAQTCNTSFRQASRCQKLPFSPFPGGAPGPTWCQVTQGYLNGSFITCGSSKDREKRQDLKISCFSQKKKMPEAPIQVNVVRSKQWLEVPGDAQLFGQKEIQLQLQGLPYGGSVILPSTENICAKGYT